MIAPDPPSVNAFLSLLIQAHGVPPEAPLRRVHHQVVVSPLHGLLPQEGLGAGLVRPGVDLVDAESVAAGEGLAARGTTARSGSLSWGAREVGSPCEWRGGARHCSRAMGGDSGLET